MRIITNWALSVEWNDGVQEELLDLPTDLAQAIDDWLTELQEE
jgi:hypothetical protein